MKNNEEACHEPTKWAMNRLCIRRGHYHLGRIAKNWTRGGGGGGGDSFEQFDTFVARQRSMRNDGEQ